MGSYLLPRARVLPVRELRSSQIPEGSVVLLHIDPSLREGLPNELDGCLGEISRHSTLINRYACDITKRRLHAEQMRIGMPCLAVSRASCNLEELVIAKTNLNYGGQPERLALEQGESIGDSSELLHEDFGPNSYWIGKAQDVPSAWWDDRSLVIERFVSNRLDAFIRMYRMRTRLAVVVAFSPHTIKKVMGDDRDCNYMIDTKDMRGKLDNCPLPSEHVRSALSLGDAMGLEYFSADIVFSDDGDWAVVDMNATPWAGKRSPPEDLLAFLRAGLEED